MGNQISSVIRMYGVTKEGYSVCAHVYNFRPYFYVEFPSGFELSQDLSAKIINDLNKYSSDPMSTCVLDLELVEKTSVMYYREKSSLFLKIYT